MMNWEMVVGIASVVMAGCALWISVWESRQTRRHNRLSVLPQVLFYADFRHSRDVVGIGFRNAGLGPLIVKSIRFTHDGRSTEVTTRGQLDLLMVELGMPQRTLTNTLVDSGAVFAAGSEAMLVGLKVDDSEDRKTLRRMLNGILTGVEVDIDYESLYGDRLSKHWVI